MGLDLESTVDVAVTFFGLVYDLATSLTCNTFTPEVALLYHHMRKYVK